MPSRHGPATSTQKMNLNCHGYLNRRDSENGGRRRGGVGRGGEAWQRERINGVTPAKSTPVLLRFHVLGPLRAPRLQLLVMMVGLVRIVGLAAVVVTAMVFM